MTSKIAKLMAQAALSGNAVAPARRLIHHGLLSFAAVRKSASTLISWKEK